MADVKQLTVTAPINIALIKYWGKRDEELVIPLNDSLSTTIDELWAKTTVKVSSSFEDDSLVLNGVKVDLSSHRRFHSCLSQLKMATHHGMPNWKCQVISETNFPTSVGLASSAAGFAALVFGVGQIFGLDLNTVSSIARLGSGSASRSIFDGFVKWEAGKSPSASDCLCRTVFGSSHWPELRAVIVVVSDSPKLVASTTGMQASVNTSELLSHRVKECVAPRLEKLKAAISNKDFPVFAELVMRESNQLHAVCMDTFPPLFYMNDGSKLITQLVHAYNSRFGTRVAYTFDAGPNCCLFMEEKTLKEFLAHFCFYFPNQLEEKFIRGVFVGDLVDRGHLENLAGVKVANEVVQYIIVSKVGGGPKVIVSQ